MLGAQVVFYPARSCNLDTDGHVGAGSVVVDAGIFVDVTIRCALDAVCFTARSRRGVVLAQVAADFAIRRNQDPGGGTSHAGIIAADIVEKPAMRTAINARADVCRSSVTDPDA